MDRSQRHQEKKSFQSAAKSFATSSLLIAFLISCSSKTTLPEGLQQALSDPSAPALDVTSLGIQITRSGINDMPFLTEDGRKILYVGRRRNAHSLGQVYIFDLDNLKERRITYQDGESRDPIVLKGGQQLFYASSTDELKERPLLLLKEIPDSPLPPTDIYMSDFSGANILRLTDRPGFDGLLWPRHDRPESLLFSIWNGKFLEVHQLNTKTKQSIPLLRKKDRSIESLRLSPNGKRWAWIERHPTGETQVIVGQLGAAESKNQVLVLPNGDYKEVAWLSEDEIVINGKSLNKYYQFYHLNLKSQCLTNLIESHSDLFSPRMNREGTLIVFTSSSGGSSQIFYKTLTTSDKCLKWQEKN